MNPTEFITESNRIEGILRPPTTDEVNEFRRFMKLDKITIGDLEQFVSIYQPGAVLRDKPGLDVYIGFHTPPRGGPEIRIRLAALLSQATQRLPILTKETFDNPFLTHVAYERLHPFTDGNGRSGRMLWAWQMREIRLRFLHLFYYQTLGYYHYEPENILFAL